MSIHITTRSILLIFLVISSILIAAHIITQMGVYLLGWNAESGLIENLNLNKEESLPTIFSSFLLLFSALLLGTITYLKHNSQGNFVIYWGILCITFLFLAVDEFYRVHERFNVIFNFDDSQLTFLSFGWVVPYALLAIVFLLWNIRFLRQLPKKTAFLFMLAGGLYVGGALGVELIGSIVNVHVGRDSILYVAVSTIEETLEIAGVLTLIYTLLDYMHQQWEDLSITLN